MRIAGSLRSEKQAMRGRTFGLPTWMMGRPYAPRWDFDRCVQEGFEKVTWVFRCVNAYATRLARIPKVIRDGDPETGSVIEGHPMLPTFNGKTAPWETANYFWLRVSSHVLLSKLGAFVEVVRTNAGDVHSLHLLPPGKTKPIPGSHPGVFLDGFEVKVSDSRGIRLRPEDVLWIRIPHPNDPYASQTPLEPLGLSVDTDWWAKLYQRNFLKNDGRPGTILFVKGAINEDDADELKSKFQGGPGAAGGVSVVESTVEGNDGIAPGGGVDVVDLAKSPRDMAWLDGRKATKEEIIAGFAVPESIASGNASERKFANADAEQVTFWQDAMRDHMSFVFRPFDALLGDAEYLGANLSTVSALQRLEEERRKSGLEELRAGGITINEYRHTYPRLESVRGGDLIRQPVNLVPIAEDVDTRPPPSALSQDDELSGKDKTDDPGNSDLVDFGPYKVSHWALAAAKTFADRRWRQWEGLAIRRLREFFSRQERQTIQRLRAARTLRGTRHWEGKGIDHAGKGDKQIDPSQVFDRTAWAQQMNEVMEPLWLAIIEDYGASVLEAALGSGERGEDGAETKDFEQTFDVGDPRVLEFLNRRRNRVVGITETTWHAIREAVMAGEEHGEGIDQIASRIQKVFGEASKLRARTIARTELLSASNEGSLEGARQSGVVENKTWLSIPDDRVRETHAEAEGQTVPLEQPFVVGGVELMYPGDPGAPGEEVINCRCTQLYGIEASLLL